MKLHAAVDKRSGLIHSVVVIAANVHELTPAPELPHSEEKTFYANAGYQCFAKRPVMAGETKDFKGQDWPAKGTPPQWAGAARPRMFRR
jgi:IS5 family transposase